ncbi:membrane protein [Streptomyces heliomycini]
MDRVRTVVPLSFLTADRAFDTADDVALPYDDRDAGGAVPSRAVAGGAAALLLLLASFVLFAAVIIATTATADVRRDGLRRRTGRRGRRAATAAHGRVGELPRAAPCGLRDHPYDGPGSRSSPCARCSSRCAGWGLPRTGAGQALVIARRGRSAESPAPLLTSHNADFLGRDKLAFDRAADTVEAWAAEYRRD